MNSTQYKSEEIKIIHFVGPIKPWSLESPYTGWWLRWRLEFEKFSPNSLSVVKRSKAKYKFLYKFSKSKSGQFIIRFLPNSFTNLVLAIYSKPINGKMNNSILKNQSRNLF